MITINEFARLCGCNAQTLRYYDRIGLLRPARVDEWSSYRYYEPAQAVDFVKIKNLQQADFSIGEIRRLLNASDSEVQAAFEEKIARQQAKLEQIIHVRDAYLKEKNVMEELIRTISGLVVNQITDYAALADFGIPAEEGDAVVALIREYFDGLLPAKYPDDANVSFTVNGQTVSGAADALALASSLPGITSSDTIILTLDNEDMPEPHPAAAPILFERHGWHRALEFLPDLPRLEDGHEYEFELSLCEDKHARGGSYSLFLLAAVLRQQRCMDIPVSIVDDDCTDGRNHVILRQTK